MGLTISEDLSRGAKLDEMFCGEDTSDNMVIKHCIFGTTMVSVIFVACGIVFRSPSLIGIGSLSCSVVCIISGCNLYEYIYQRKQAETQPLMLSDAIV